MKTVELTFPELALIAGTRGMLGAGIALLLADHINVEQRRAIGWTLFGIGARTDVIACRGTGEPTCLFRVALGNSSPGERS